MRKVIENPLFIVREGDDGLLYSVVTQGSVFSGEGASLIIDSICEISGGRPRPLCHDISGIKSADRSALEYVVSKKARECIAAMAILVNSPIARVIGSLFLGIRKTPYPCKLFTSKEESVAWLKDYL